MTRKQLIEKFYQIQKKHVRVVLKSEEEENVSTMYSGYFDHLTQDSVVLKYTHGCTTCFRHIPFDPIADLFVSSEYTPGEDW